MAKGSPDGYPWSGTRRMAATGGGFPFEQSITIPKNTPVGSPVTQEIVLVKGFVTSGEVVIPKGCAGLVGISIFDQATQLFPKTAGTWFSGDARSIWWDCDYDVPQVGGTYKLTIRGYNDDDTNVHKPIVTIWVVCYPS